MSAPAHDPLIDLVRFVGQRLVDHPEELTVTSRTTGDHETLVVRVNPDDFGRVIGRQGRTVKALRSVVKHAAARRGQRVTVEVEE
jgi:predicted RNA-binding protein YlqC (UPF0109 family)